MPVNVGDPLPADADILLGGGGQDAAQGELGADFVGRARDLRAMADDGVVMLDDLRLLPVARPRVPHPGRACASPGVGVLDVVTRGQRDRLIGNNVVDTAATPGGWSATRTTAG